MVIDRLTFAGNILETGIGVVLDAVNIVIGAATGSLEVASLVLLLAQSTVIVAALLLSYQPASSDYLRAPLPPHLPLRQTRCSRRRPRRLPSTPARPPAPDIAPRTTA